MPGWATHIIHARKTILGLQSGTLPMEIQNLLAASKTTGANANDASALGKIANEYSGHLGAGAIGPDLFFLLPDYAPSSAGQTMWSAMHLVKKVYDDLDPYLGPFMDLGSKVGANLSQAIDTVSLGLVGQLGDAIKSLSAAVKTGFEYVAVTHHDVWGVLSSSGVQRGYDEQVFFWSDMLHYRKTYDFAAYLWDHAGDQMPGEDPPSQAQIDARKAYALGYSCHVAADVAGHAFINQKCGGPYRLHWQRHHLVESFADAEIYLQEYGRGDRYQEITRSALHLFCAFNNNKGKTTNADIWNAFKAVSKCDPPNDVIDSGDDGDPPNLLLDSGALCSSAAPWTSTDIRPQYEEGSDSLAFLDQHECWDFDSCLPDDLAAYIQYALTGVYAPDVAPQTDCGNGPWATRPSIIQALDSKNTTGVPSICDIKTTYWWVYHILKLITTDYYKVPPPKPPTKINAAYLANLVKQLGKDFANFPSLTAPAPASAANWNSNWNFKNILQHIYDFLDLLVKIVDWAINVIADLLALAIAGTLNALGLSGLLYDLEEFIYLYLEVPLYEMYLAMHALLTYQGYTYPFAHEMTPALTTLGRGWDSVWLEIEAALDDALGFLTPTGPVSCPGPAPVGSQTKVNSEPSGYDVDTAVSTAPSKNESKYPHDVVSDPLLFVQTYLQDAKIPDIDFLQFVPAHTPCGLWGTLQGLSTSTLSTLLGETPSAFAAPWRFPTLDNTLDKIPSEYPTTVASPYKTGTKSTVLVDANGTWGDKAARVAFESAKNAQDTDAAASSYLTAQKYMGDPVQYGIYFLAMLTRDPRGPLVNFNLDSDRGYGYKCWDWTRSHTRKAIPGPFDKPAFTYKRVYQAPVRPGYGWCHHDMDNAGAKVPDCKPGSPAVPAEHDPSANPPAPVQIRYIDLEDK